MRLLIALVITFAGLAGAGAFTWDQCKYGTSHILRARGLTLNCLSNKVIARRTVIIFTFSQGPARGTDINEMSSSTWSPSRNNCGAAGLLSRL